MKVFSTERKPKPKKIKLMRMLLQAKSKGVVAAAVIPPSVVPNTASSTSSNSFQSCLHRHTEADYTSKERESDFFPFMDKFSALMSIWFTNSQVSLEDYDNLLTVICDKDFTGKHLVTGRKVLEKLERQLPVIQPESITVSRRITTGKVKNSFVVSKVQVLYYSPLQFTIQLMADPLCRPHLLLTKGEYSKETKVTNFNQSPLFHENFLWSKLMSFLHMGIEFRVGEFVLLTEGDASV
jgi:hypothetical protein